MVFLPDLIPQPDWDKYHFLLGIVPYLILRVRLQGLIPLRDQCREILHAPVHLSRVEGRAGAPARGAPVIATARKVCACESQPCTLQRRLALMI